MAVLFDTGALESLRRPEREAEALAIRYFPPVICAHVAGEFLYGMAWAQVIIEAFVEGQAFLQSFELLMPGFATAATYSRLRADARIAAHAMESRLPLVTLDGHFLLLRHLDVRVLGRSV